MPTHLQSLTRLYNAIMNRSINKTWITTLEPDGGAPWRELTDALEETVEQIENNTMHKLYQENGSLCNNADRAHDKLYGFPSDDSVR